MAQDANVTDVWAKYGVADQRPEYELLRRVTHWADEDVHREKELSVSRAVAASHVLEKTPLELLEMFEFRSFQAFDREAVLETWKTTVSVQQHFNDLELRIRSFAITVVVAVLGGAALSIKDNLRVTVLGASISVGVLWLVAGLVGWAAFYVMDRHWYHRLLRGAVEHGLFIERRHGRAIPELALTSAIGRASPIPIGKARIHSSQKMNYFYGSVAALLAGLIVVLLLAGGPIANTTTANSDESTAAHEKRVPETPPSENQR